MLGRAGPPVLNSSLHAFLLSEATHWPLAMGAGACHGPDHDTWPVRELEQILVLFGAAVLLAAAARPVMGALSARCLDNHTTFR